MGIFRIIKIGKGKLLRLLRKSFDFYFTPFYSLDLKILLDLLNHIVHVVIASIICVS